MIEKPLTIAYVCNGMPPEYVGQAQRFLNRIVDGQIVAKSGIGVVGDLGLDRFVFGGVDRISPEAPVPVLLIDKIEEELGCAANVIRSLSVFTQSWKDFPIRVFGVVGADENGRQLLEKFAQLPRSIDLDIIKDPSRPTTLKTRFIAGSQHQLLRVDAEKTSPLAAVLESKLLADLEQHIATTPYLILEDYAKGLFSERFASGVIELARSKKVKTLVDPHRNTPPQFFKNSWLIKPNVAEAEILLGRDLKKGQEDELIASAGREIQERFDIANVIISRSRFGSTLVDETGLVQHFPAIARAVFDVTGAGDTFLAILAASLAGGATIPVACVLANAAASVVVGKVGTASATVDEMLAELAHK